jgi:hypothetical protein
LIDTVAASLSKVSKQKRRQVKAHPVWVQKGQAAKISIEIILGYLIPIVLFVSFPEQPANILRLTAVNAICLSESYSALQRYSVKRLNDLGAKSFTFQYRIRVVIL